MTIDHRKVVALATHETPFVKRVDDIDDYQVTTTVTRYTKSVWLTDRFKDAALDLNFAYNKSLTDSITGNNLVTFSRASSGTYVGADGLIKTTPVNLLSRSEQINYWTKYFGATVTSNSIAAPDGTVTADFVDISAQQYSQIVKPVNVQPSTTYTVSFYARSVTGTDIVQLFRWPNITIDFTLTTEWKRFTNTFTTNSTTTTENVLFTKRPGSTNQFYLWGVQVEEGSTATDYIPTGATISGAPRFDHDPVTGESLGLLIEEARTNLVTYSEQLNQWGRGPNTTVTTNAATAPDGTNTADRLQMSASGGTYAGSNNFILNGRTYTGSVYVKAVTPGTNDQFTLSFGGESPVNATSTFTATGEWQRFEATKTPSLSSATRPFVINNEGDNFAVDIYVWGVQVEEASFATSYIPTTSSQVTRAADVVEITGTDFSSFYNQSEGTVFAEYNVLRDKTGFSQFIYDFSDGTNNNAIRQFKRSNNNETVSTARTNGNIQGRIEGNTNTPFNERYKTAYALDGTDAQRAIKGIASSEFGVSMPTVDRLRLGGRQDNTFLANCHISRFVYFPTRLTDALLQAITS